MTLTAEAPRLGIEHFATSTVFFLSLPHQLTFFKHLDTLISKKIFLSKGKVEIAFEDFLTSIISYRHK